MSPILEKASDIEVLIASRLRERRETLGLTLEALAGRSGVSRAMISKVERSEASPTAALLGRLCNGLGITLSSLMASAEESTAPLARAGEQPRWRDPATGLVRTAVSPSLAGSSIEIVRIELPPGAVVEYGAVRRLDYSQHVLILDGTLGLSLGAQRFALSPGDCLFMRPSEPVSFANETPSPCRYLVVVNKSPEAAGRR